MQGCNLHARVRVFMFQESLQQRDLYKYTCRSGDDFCEMRVRLTDLRVGALDVDGLQINVEAHHKGVPPLGVGLQLVGCDCQRGGAAHGLHQAQAPLLAQQGVHAELAQAHRPGKGITWWWKTQRTEKKQKHSSFSFIRE